MLILFLRTIFLYLFLLFILRLTGKRQVADLEPFDLIVTLVIADVGSNAISDPNIPLLYSVVPIIGLYCIQQVIARVCLKSDRLRRIVCGTPQFLIRKGVLDERVLRQTNYTVHDVIDHLREKDVFNLDEVADAVLETNGSMSVRLYPAFEPAERADLSVTVRDEETPQLLLHEGRFDAAALRAAGLSEKQLTVLLNRKHIKPKEVFFAQLNTEGRLHVQLDEQHGGRVVTFPSVR